MNGGKNGRNITLISKETLTRLNCSKPWKEQKLDRDGHIKTWWGTKKLGQDQQKGKKNKNGRMIIWEDESQRGKEKKKKEIEEKKWKRIVSGWDEFPVAQSSCDLMLLHTRINKYFSQTLYFLAGFVAERERACDEIKVFGVCMRREANQLTLAK